MMEPLDATELAADAALLASPHQQQQQVTRSGQQSAAAANSRAATTWSTSYSLSKSVRAMIGVTRLRKGSAGSESESASCSSSLSAGTPGALAKCDDAEQQREKAHKRLLLAIESKNEQGICELVAQDPQTLRVVDEVWITALLVRTWAVSMVTDACWIIITQDDRLPLHLVCALAPNFLFVDVIAAMVSEYGESAGCMDTVWFLCCLVTAAAIDTKP